MTARAKDNAMHFSQTLIRNIRLRGSAIAVEDGKRTVSWVDLHDRAWSLCSGMVTRGLKSGDRVAVLDVTGLAYIVACHAAALGGFVFTPLNARLVPGETLAQLDSSGAGLVLVGAACAAHAEAWPEVWRLRVLALDDVLDDVGDARTGSAPTDPVILTTLLHTGGTTGQAKGVMLSSRAMIANAAAVVDTLDLTEDDRCLLTAPLFHVSGLAMVWAAALVGATAVPQPVFDPALVLRNLAERRITTVFLAPTMIRMILDDPAFDPSSFATVRNLLYGASPITETVLRELLDRLPWVRLTQAYGQTEICPLTLLTHEDHLRAVDGNGAILRSAGRPPAGTDLKVVDEAGADCPPGQAGEVCGRSLAIMDGYYGTDDLTGETMETGFVRTGDIGVIDAEGYLTLIDRSRDMIVTGGENVYSTEVENVLAAHPAIRQVAIIAVPDDRWGERVHGVLLLKDTVSDADLDAHCRRSLAAYKCPKSFERVDAMPLTAAGKIDKKALRLPWWPDSQRAIG